MNIRKYDLIKIIKKDFISYGRIYFLLFIITIFTSICIVITVHQTRLLTIQEENLTLKKKKKLMNGETCSSKKTFYLMI